MAIKMPTLKKTRGPNRLPFTYLDNGSTTCPKPEIVYQYMSSFYRCYGVNPGRSKGHAFERAEQLLDQTRRRLTDFFNGQDHLRLIFTYNVTDALNMIINGIVKTGDHVITSHVEHNAVIRPLNHLARKISIDVDWVPLDKRGFIDPADIKKRIRNNTKLVIINHGSNVIGTIQPIAEIGRICARTGVIFAIDAAQTAGVVPIDMKKNHIDIVAFTGHKSLLGPMGIGGMQISSRVDIEATRFGGTGILSELPYQPEKFPNYLESGTPNMIGVAGLFAAQEYLKQRGIDAIYRHEMRLAKKLHDGLQKIKGITLYNEPRLDTHVGMISFNLEGKKAGEVGAILSEKFDIYSRPGLHCAPLVHRHLGTIQGGTVRLSIGPFNTAAEIDKTIHAVCEIARMKSDGTTQSISCFRVPR